MAPGVVKLPLESVPDTLHGRELQTVVVTVGAGGELRDCSESRVPGLKIGERREAAWAHRLVAIRLGHIDLVHSPRTHVLRVELAGVSELTLDAQAPLHEVGGTEFAVRRGA